MQKKVKVVKNAALSSSSSAMKSNVIPISSAKAAHQALFRNQLPKTVSPEVEAIKKPIKENKGQKDADDKNFFTENDLETMRVLFPIEESVVKEYSLKSLEFNDGMYAESILADKFRREVSHTILSSPTNASYCLCST